MSHLCVSVENFKISTDGHKIDIKATKINKFILQINVLNFTNFNAKWKRSMLSFFSTNAKKFANTP